MSNHRATSLPNAPQGCASDSEFQAVSDAYRPTGGILCSHELARGLEQGCAAYLMSLEKLMAARIVFGFDWRGTCWIPMFQFDRNLSIRPASRLALAELAALLDGWALAVWFVRPHVWLNNLRPVDVIESDPDAVMRTARTQRREACAGAEGRAPPAVAGLPPPRGGAPWRYQAL